MFPISMFLIKFYYVRAVSYKLISSTVIAISDNEKHAKDVLGRSLIDE